MTPVPPPQASELDRGLLMLTAVAILGLLVLSTAAAGGFGSRHRPNLPHPAPRRQARLG